MNKTLEYYFEDGSHVEFNKYTIDTNGIVRSKKTDKIITRKSGKYNRVGIRDDDSKQRYIQVGRAIASTFIGRPPTPDHTVDHKDRDLNNDMLDNIRWLCATGQFEDQDRPKPKKPAYVIVKDGVCIIGRYDD
jgi:hypothetical protein